MVLLLDQGRYAEALRHVNDLTDLARTSGIQQVLAAARLGRGLLYLQQAEDSPELASVALDALNDGLALMRRIGRTFPISPGLVARAAVHRLRRDFDLARKDLDEALFITTRGSLGLLQRGHPSRARPAAPGDGPIGRSEGGAGGRPADNRAHGLSPP